MEVIEWAKELLEGKNVRILGTIEKPLFVARDIGNLLDININDNFRNLDDNEKVSGIVKTAGGNQNMSLLTEVGLYHVMFASKKESAKRFRKWIIDTLIKIRLANKHDNVNNNQKQDPFLFYRVLFSNLVTDDVIPAEQTGFVYFIVECPFNNRVKIGKSINPTDRLRSLQTRCPTKLTIWRTIESSLYGQLEGELHHELAEHNIRGEWFYLTSVMLEGVWNLVIHKHESIKKEGAYKRLQQIPTIKPVQLHVPQCKDINHDNDHLQALQKVRDEYDHLIEAKKMLLNAEAKQVKEHNETLSLQTKLLELLQEKQLHNSIDRITDDPLQILRPELPKIEIKLEIPNIDATMQPVPIISQAQKWIKANPPKNNMIARSYYEKYMVNNNVHIQNLKHFNVIVREIGYRQKNIRGARCWTRIIS